eukprot:TRINITY_DN48191_c0_g1_i1.p1 TRINITY_DN48191_c0_g1~~TRINITY_DN48191_c0_g1_i1.p1  ORF type:complete len:1787 (+),score=242.54 TRINITY_DN48191_c0_g1_i1:701-5362(+)
MAASSETSLGISVATHNKVVMVRLSMKRFKLNPPTAEFRRDWRVYQQKPTSVSVNPATFDERHESTDSFGDSLECRECTYTFNAGYKAAGGFIATIRTEHLDKGDLMQTFNRLADNNWFDLNQASLVFEMIVFNENVDMYVALACIFQHRVSGITTIRIESHYVDLSWTSGSKLIWIVVANIFIFAFVVFFGRIEFMELSADYKAYLVDIKNWICLSTLAVSLGIVVTTLRLLMNHTYLFFELPLPHKNETAVKYFDVLTDFGFVFEQLGWLISVNTALSFANVILPLSKIQPDCGIWIDTLGRVKAHLLGMFVVSGVLIVVWSLSGCMILGHSSPQYISIQSACFATTKIFLGTCMPEGLSEWGDAVICIYFILMYKMFMFVKLPFAIIIIFGHDLQKNDIKKLSEADRYPSLASLERFYTCVRKLLEFVRKSASTFCRAAQEDGSRVDFAMVAALREKKSTYPVIRRVRYEAKETHGYVEIDEDITLRARNPSYQHGMMQYYVNSVLPQGPASIAKVERGFRLVSIERRGVVDRELFRCPRRFHSSESSEMGYDWNAQNVLKRLRDDRDRQEVILEFEGKLPAFSTPCVMLFLFTLVHVLVSTGVVRVKDLFELNFLLKKQTENIVYAEDSHKFINFSTMSGHIDVVNWAYFGLPEITFPCVLSSFGTSDCHAGNIRLGDRKDWFLYSSTGTLGNEEAIVMPGVSLPLLTKPSGAEGLSMGYIPLAGEARPRVKTVSVSQMPVTATFNVGVMPNNNVRATFQHLCFDQSRVGLFQTTSRLRLNKLAERYCADRSCMREMLVDFDDGEMTCFDSQGYERNPRQKMGVTTGAIFEYSKTNSFHELGGTVIGMGNTLSEARRIVSAIEMDRLFDKDLVSVVFEVVTYNANYDLFSITSMRISLPSTGIVVTDVIIDTFPLKLFSQGPTGDTSRNLLLISLFVCWVLFSIYFLVFFLMALYVHFRIATELRHSMRFIVPIGRLFQEDWWNCLDAASNLVNVFLIVYFFQILYATGSLSLSDTFVDKVDLTTKDNFDALSNVATLYSRFVIAIGLNAILLPCRLCKYFRVIRPVHVLMRAAKDSVFDLLILTFMGVGTLGCFSLMYYLRLGLKFRNAFGNLPKASANLFEGLWLMGFDFEVRTVDSSGFGLFLFFHFIFILLKSMYLAAVLYSWKVTRRDAQPFSFNLQSSLGRLKLRYNKPALPEDVTKLDSEFWQSCSILCHLRNIDDDGRICSSPRNNLGAAGTHAFTAEDNDIEEESGNSGMTWEQHPEACKKWLAIVFKRAHMQIAEQFSRRIEGKKQQGHAKRTSIKSSMAPQMALRDGDSSEVYQMEEVDQHASFFWTTTDVQRKEVAEELEDPSELKDSKGGAVSIEYAKHKDPDDMSSRIVSASVADKIQATFRTLLRNATTAHCMWELRLDALITALEETRLLDRIHNAFVPEPMPLPTRVRDRQLLNRKKLDFERQMGAFYQWLSEETTLRHLSYLKDSAIAKERSMKQQTLILTEYLEHLDEQIQSITNHIKVLHEHLTSLRRDMTALVNDDLKFPSSQLEMEN